MSNPFDRILARYGTPVEIFRHPGEPGVTAMAMLQPVEERERQFAPSLLGWGRQERWLYLGQAEVPLEMEGDGFVRWNGREFRVYSARKVQLGRAGSHWWGMLTPREGDA